MADPFLDPSGLKVRLGHHFEEMTNLHSSVEALMAVYGTVSAAGNRKF